MKFNQAGDNQGFHHSSESSFQKANEVTSLSADYETAIAKAGFGKFNYFLFAVTLVAPGLTAMATSVLSYVLPVATCDLELSSFEKGVLNVSAFFGMTLSGLLWGLLSDSIGRKRLLTVGFMLNSAIVAAASLSASFWQMTLFKFLDGLVICGPYSIFMTYISEIFASDRRKLVVLSVGLFTSIGNILQAVFAWLVIPGSSYYDIFGLIPLKSWRVFMLSGFVPVFACGVASLFFIESPKFLLDKGRKEEALAALRRIYSINTGLPASTYPVRYLIDSRSKHGDNEYSVLPPKTKLMAGLKESLSIFRPPYGIVVLQFCFYQVASLIGLNIIRLWLPQLLSDIDSNPNNVTSWQTMCEAIPKPSENFDLAVFCENLVLNSSLYLIMMTLYSGYLVGQVIFLSTVSYVGKKTYATGTIATAAIALAILPNVPVNFILIPSLLCVSCLNVTHFCLLGTIVEVFPTSVRATGLSTIVAVGRLATVVVNLFVSSLLYTHCSQVYYFISALAGAAAIGSFFMPTKPFDE